MYCKCGSEIGKRNKTGLCRSCAAKLWKRKPKKQIGEIWMRPSDKYFVIKTEDGIQEYHRWLMEQKIGRRLNSNETVHHIDFNKLNNDVNNLLLCTISEHMSIHAKHSNNFDEYNKTHEPWNKGRKTGRPSWNSGKKMPPMSQEQKDILRQKTIEARKKKFWSTKKV